MSFLKRQKVQEDFADRTYSQWALMGSLAFAERAGIVIAAALFFLDKTQDFWTVPGVIFAGLHLMFVAPVFGIFIYFTNNAVYAWLKKKKQLPLDIKGYKRMGWAANIFWLPWMSMAAYIGFNVYYDVVAEILKPL